MLSKVFVKLGPTEDISKCCCEEGDVGGHQQEAVHLKVGVVNAMLTSANCGVLPPGCTW